MLKEKIASVFHAIEKWSIMVFSSLEHSEMVRFLLGVV